MIMDLSNIKKLDNQESIFKNDNHDIRQLAVLY